LNGTGITIKIVRKKELIWYSTTHISLNFKLMNEKKYSIVVPIFNEEGAVKQLHTEIVEAMNKLRGIMKYFY